MPHLNETFKTMGTIMKLSKYTVTTLLFTGLFAASVANAQTTKNETNSSLRQIVSDIVINALKDTTDEIDLQLENVKVKASQMLSNLNLEGSDLKTNELNKGNGSEVSLSADSKEITEEVQQTNSTND